MKNAAFILTLLALAAVATTTLAEEVIYFKNGTSMPVRSHEVEGEMIKVDMGGDGFMAFPMSQVERIEKADGDVMLQPSSQSNQIIAPDPSTRVYGTPPRDPDVALPYKRPAGGHKIEPDRNGVASYAPFANSGHPGKAKLRIAGNKTVLNHRAARNAQEGVQGATRVGQRAVLPAKGPKKKDMRGVYKREE